MPRLSPSEKKKRDEENARKKQLLSEYKDAYDGSKRGRGEYMKGLDQYKEDRAALDDFADDVTAEISQPDQPEVSDQVANSVREISGEQVLTDTTDQVINAVRGNTTKQLISDTNALIEKARSVRQAGEPAQPASSDFAGGLDYGKDYENPLDNEGINKIIASAPKEVAEKKPTGTGRPANIESAGQLFKNLYDQNQRLEGRKDFAASLDAAGYDPSTTSSEDKAKFYAQGKELGLTSEQIDKYRNDKITAAADLKYRRENPRDFIKREATQFGARGGLGGARGVSRNTNEDEEEEERQGLQGARGLARRTI